MAAVPKPPSAQIAAAWNAITARGTVQPAAPDAATAAAWNAVTAEAAAQPAAKPPLPSTAAAWNAITAQELDAPYTAGERDDFCNCMLHEVEALPVRRYNVLTDACASACGMGWKHCQRNVQRANTQDCALPPCMLT